MHRLRWLTYFVLAVLLAACSPSAKPPVDGSAPPAKVEAPTPAGPGQNPSPLPDPLLSPAPVDLLQRIALQAGDTVSAHGFYFLTATTGRGEGWTSTAPDFRTSYVSDDNRFVAGVGQGQGFLLDRERALTWQFNPEQLWPLLISPDGALFAEVTPIVEPGVKGATPTGRYIWTGPDFALRHLYTLAGAPTDSGQALRSPDGRRVALLRRLANGHQLLLLDLATGGTQELAWPANAPSGERTSAVLQAEGDHFRVDLLQTADQLPWQSLVQRFDWGGERLGQLEIPGAYIFFSPDGRWVAWETWPAGHFAPATVVADARTLAPRLMALGTSTCFPATGAGGSRWLADSSGLVVAAPSGGYYLLDLAAELRQPDAFAGLSWKDEPQPAPDRPDRFAIGRLAISTADGSERLGLSLSGHSTPTTFAPWVPSSEELRFALPPPSKGAACGELPPVEPQLLLFTQELPAFPLVIQSGGRCLPLLDRPTGTEITCLADGSRLQPVPERQDLPELAWVDGTWWLRVRTEPGETGWLRFDKAITFALPVAIPQ